jgi:pyridoxamine 5'-phosphate oxidase
MAAPWRFTFMEHLRDMGSPTFVLSTLHPISSRSSDSQYTPRARTLVFRGMFASLPDNPKNPAPRNPQVYESDLLAFTTDARTEKVAELVETVSSRSSASGDLIDTGGGGPVEAVFWAAKPKTQWRIRGAAYILGPNIESDSATANFVREKLLSRMRVLQEEEQSRDWSWSREVTAHFGNLSPIMRGSFKNPPPGVPVSQSPDDPRLRLGQEVTDLHDEVARQNFRVVVVVPQEVDQVDLSVAERARRWRYRYLGEGDDASLHGEKHGDWEITELWP